MTLVEAATRPQLTWRRLLRWAALADLVVMVVVGVVLRDREALGFAALVLCGLAFLRIRSGVAGVAMLGVLAADAAAWMIPAAASNAAHREAVADVTIPASLAAISLVGAVAAVASVLRRPRPPSAGVRTDEQVRAAARRSEQRAVRVVLQAAIAAFAVAVAASALRGTGGETARAGDLFVGMRSATFSPSTLEARAGEVSVAVRNRDLFWHTFTVDPLGVDVGVPTRGLRRATFEAAPGRYEYYCAVPGHRQIGMRGTLVVS